MNDYYVYMLRCSDNSLYTGISNDVTKRIKAHNNKRGAKYTRSRLPVFLVQCFGPYNKSTALKIEYNIKQLNKEYKECLCKCVFIDDCIYYISDVAVRDFDLEFIFEIELNPIRFDRVYSQIEIDSIMIKYVNIIRTKKLNEILN